MRKILALDQSSRVTGYAIFQDNALVSFGQFEVSDTDIGRRLLQIKQHIVRLINEYEITEVAFEDIQMQGNVANNVQTFKILSEVFGVIHELLTELNIPYTIVPSVSWKSKLNIKGRARAEQKKNAQNYVINTYNIKASQDTCDAICIGTYMLQQDFDWSN